MFCLLRIGTAGQHQFHRAFRRKDPQPDRAGTLRDPDPAGQQGAVRQGQIQL